VDSGCGMRLGVDSILDTSCPEQASHHLFTQVSASMALVCTPPSLCDLCNNFRKSHSVRILYFNLRLSLSLVSPWLLISSSAPTHDTITSAQPPSQVSCRDLQCRVTAGGHHSVRNFEALECEYRSQMLCGRGEFHD